MEASRAYPLIHSKRKATDNTVAFLGLCRGKLKSFLVDIFLFQKAKDFFKAR